MSALAALLLILVLLYLVIVTTLLWTGTIGAQGPVGPQGAVGPRGPPGYSLTRQIFVSKLGDDSNDGLSWETSVLTIVHAVSIAPEGWEILVGPGTFDEKQEIVVDKNLRLTGFEGKETTILTRDLSSEKHRILSLRSVGAACAGFTIENGETAADRCSWEATLR
jgi:hypothetical protein